jgi:hypothetical protein
MVYYAMMFMLNFMKNFKYTRKLVEITNIYMI